jgi:hypothetical protein
VALSRHCHRANEPILFRRAWVPLRAPRAIWASLWSEVPIGHADGSILKRPILFPANLGPPALRRLRPASKQQPAK